MSNARTLAALQNAKDKQDQQNARIDSQLTSEIDDQLKEVDVELVNQVRRKEYQQHYDAENNTAAKKHRKALLYRLPEALGHIRAIYRLKKKTTLELDSLVAQLCGIMPTKKKEVYEMIDLIISLNDEWGKINIINEKKYLKINPAVNITAFKTKIAEEISKIVE